MNINGGPVRICKLKIKRFCFSVSRSTRLVILIKNMYTLLVGNASFCLMSETLPSTWRIHILYGESRIYILYKNISFIASGRKTLWALWTLPSSCYIRTDGHGYFVGRKTSFCLLHTNSFCLLHTFWSKIIVYSPFYLLHTFQLLYRVGNPFDLWGRKRFLLPVTYFPTRGQKHFL